MENQKFEIKIDGDTKELIIREGGALPVKEQRVVSVTGTIEAPKEFLAKRLPTIDRNKSHVLFSYDGMYIKFNVNEDSHYQTTIVGKTELNPELVKFRINTEKLWTKDELKQFLKMNRANFNELDANMKIITNLAKFSANIQAQIDDQSDDRGNAKKGVEVSVKTDLDLNFVLNMPIFTGQPKSKFKVDICFDVRDKGINLWFESPELQELILAQREKLINDNVEPFKKDFVVIQQ